MIIKHCRAILGTFLLLLAAAGTAHGQQEMSQTQVSSAYYKSYTYAKAGNYDDAIKALQLVYQTYPRTFGVNNRLGYLYNLNGKFKNAEHHYKQAISALPDALTPKLGLMYTYLLAQRFDDASELGYQILRIDYYSYYGNLRLAYVLRQQSNLDMAESVLIKMLARYPADPLYLTELGLLTLARGEAARSREIMTEVLILDPENVTAQSVLLSLQE